MLSFKKKNGQAVVEIALVLPVILLLLCSIFEFGRIYNASLLITNASREGVREAVLGATDIDIVNAVNAAVPILDPSSITVTITPSESDRIQGVTATVRIDYNVSIITPVISSILPNPFPISARTVMRVE